jgi:hypothetical protein
MTENHDLRAAHEPGDELPAELHYDKGGVPWYLLVYYLAFLTFFTWYVLEYQLPEFLEEGPGGQALVHEQASE